MLRHISKFGDMAGSLRGERREEGILRDVNKFHHHDTPPAQLPSSQS
jgi:hypothetical protein